MFYVKKAYCIRIFRTALIIAVALAISAVMKSNAPAQQNGFPGDHRNYENHNGIYNRNGLDRGGFRGGLYHSPRPFKDVFYSVKDIKDNPAAFGAVLAYMDGDWGKKYMYWAPGNFNKQKMRPLVISLHGNDEGVADAFARLYDTVLQYNYAFVAPEWKSGDKIMAPEEISAFIDGIISELKDKGGLNLEPARMILHGYERGANMAGYLSYYNPGKYVMVIVDSGPFPDISSASDSGAFLSGSTLSIPANELKKLAGRYIYLYSRYEDPAMYLKLEESRKALVAAGANAELNYTKDLLPGDFSKSLSKSIVDMFDRATAGK